MCRLQVRRDTGKQSAHWTHISERELAADAHSRNQYRRGRRRKRGRCARSVGLPRHASTHWPSRHSPLYYVGLRAPAHCASTARNCAESIYLHQIAARRRSIHSTTGPHCSTPLMMTFSIASKLTLITSSRLTFLARLTFRISSVIAHTTLL